MLCSYEKTSWDSLSLVLQYQRYKYLCSCKVGSTLELIVALISVFLKKTRKLASTFFTLFEIKKQQSTHATE